MRARSATAEEESSPMDSIEEWVEVQGRTVDVAVDVAIRELGLQSRDDVKVEIMQEAKVGFLGMGSRDAIVKVSKAPKRRRKRRSRGQRRDSMEGTPDQRNAGRGRANQGKQVRRPRQEKQVSKTDPKKREGEMSERPEQAPIEEQATIAAGFITGLLEAFGLEGTVETRIDDDVLYIDVQGTETEALVGAKGTVMQSVHELTRTVVQRKTYGAPRMRIDIAGYRARRKEALTIYTRKLAAQVIEDQSEVMLEAMNAADRKVIHDAVGDIEGVRSYSEGEEPRRAVVIAFEVDS